jgi:hypothetical protein
MSSEPSLSSGKNERPKDAMVMKAAVAPRAESIAIGVGNSRSFSATIKDAPMLLTQATPSGGVPAPELQPFGKVPSEKKIVAPLPTTPIAQARPPWRSAIRATVASPMPVPGNSLSVWRRWKGANKRAA